MSRLAYLPATVTSLNAGRCETSHALPEGDVLATVASRAGSTGFAELLSLHFAAPAREDIWCQAVLPSAHLTELLDAVTLRRVLRGHLLALHAERVRQGTIVGKLRPLESTTFRYVEFRNWGEASPVSLIAEADGVDVTAVHNRLRKARANGWLPAPGAGRRTPADEASQVAAALADNLLLLDIKIPRGKSVANAVWWSPEETDFPHESR